MPRAFTLGREVELPIEKIHPNPKNPRYEVGDVTELAAAMQEVGQLQACTVSPAYHFGIGHVMLESGHRRWTAARANGWKTLRCNIRDAVAGEGGLPPLLTAVIENVHRKDLSAMEKAQSFGRMRDEFHLTATEISERTGISQATVSRHLTLLELNEASQELVRSGKVSVEFAVGAVREYRKKDRKKKGHQPVNIGWEPLWFARTHPLAKRAKTLCDARQHNNRRRLDGVACGQCFEQAVRDDQDTVRVATAASLDAPFLAPTRVTIDPYPARQNGGSH